MEEEKPTMTTIPSPPPPAAAPMCWSNVLKSQPPPKPKPQAATVSSQVFVESCKSTKGIAVAVIDANAVIQGGDNLHNLADKFVTVPEVLNEIRDPVSRHRLALIPFTIDSMEPTPEALNTVIKFAKATGDLQTLSDVDLKLIALTYSLEGQIHGTQHLRDAPPPVQTVNVKRLPEKEMPGWGSNVPNLEEWEALEQEAGDGSNLNSRILPLKDVDLNAIVADDKSEAGSVATKGDEECSENQDDFEEDGRRKYKRYPAKKIEVNIEGKKMVAAGVDASQGEIDDDGSDWLPAVSKSTHRKFLRRKAKYEHHLALSEKECQRDMEQQLANDNKKEISNSAQLPAQGLEENTANGSSKQEGEGVNNGDENLTSILEQMRLEEESLETLPEGNAENNGSSEIEGMENSGVDNEVTQLAGEDVDVTNAELDTLDTLSETNESTDTRCVDDSTSEQSWMLRSLSESTVACVTGDFAMQNVLLQIGLRLLAPGGMQIRQLHRWILKCHACYTVTAEIGRLFCPKCGNGGTLRKVAVTVGENGVILSARRPRISLRGTKFSLPLPQSGRDAITKNPILREDQIPQKYLRPKTKKKNNNQDDDFFISSGDIFGKVDKRTAFKPPVGKAFTLYGGRKNPNDNHYARHNSLF
ncbi:RNA-binding NOB1-like protein [Linum perenne]